jgi:hypothetical protein
MIMCEIENTECLLVCPSFFSLLGILLAIFARFLYLLFLFIVQPLRVC